MSEDPEEDDESPRPDDEETLPAPPNWQPRAELDRRDLGVLSACGRRMGRPSKLTQEVGDIVLDGIKRGMPISLAARRAGIHRDTIYGWLEKGEADPDSAWALFSDALKRAEAEIVYRHLQQIDAGMDKWQASAWFLERRYPEDFGLKKDQAPPTMIMFGGPPVPKDEALPPGAVA